MIKLDFEKIYQLFDGRVMVDKNCGLVCNHACCYPSKTGSFIAFLPGELEYLRKKLKKRLPFIKTSNGHFHCSGNERCVYKLRPIDCRSYPLWPFVEEGRFVGFADCRGNRCLLKKMLENFIKRIRKGWNYIFKNKEMFCWVEKTYARGPLIIFPEYAEKKYQNKARGRNSISG